jgi:hypothetical protein
LKNLRQTLGKRQILKSVAIQVASVKRRAVTDLNQALSSLMAWQGIRKVHDGISIVDELRVVLNLLKRNGN